MSTTSRLAASAVLLMAVGVLSACGPPGTATIGVGIDAAGRPVGYLKVCDGELIDGAALLTEPITSSSRAIASWDARPAATGSTSWSLDNPEGVWVVRRAVHALKPGVVYHLEAGADDGSGYSGYVLFTLEDLHAMQPGQVRVYDHVRTPPAGEPTGSDEQQAREENNGFMRVVTQREFERGSCLQ